MNSRIIPAACFAVCLMLLCHSAAAAAESRPYASAKFGIHFRDTLTEEYTSNNGSFGSSTWNDELELDNGYGGGGAIGVKVNGLRVEGEVFYQQSGIKEFNVTTHSSFLLPAFTHITLPIDDAELKVRTFLLNVYYDFDMKSGFSPYLGGGIGTAKVKYDDLTLDFYHIPIILPGDSDHALAYQLSAGLGYAVNENITLDLSYRYFSTSDLHLQIVDDDLTTHNILLGVRYYF